MVLQVIAMRIVNLDIDSVHEQTCKAAVKVALHEYCEKTRTWPKYIEVYQWVNDFKETFHSVKKPMVRTANIVRFPHSPEGIPEALFAKAYSPGDPPITKLLVNWHQMDKHIPL